MHGAFMQLIIHLLSRHVEAATELMHLEGGNGGAAQRLQDAARVPPLAPAAGEVCPQAGADCERAS